MKSLNTKKNSMNYKLKIQITLIILLMAFPMISSIYYLKEKGLNVILALAIPIGIYLFATVGTFMLVNLINKEFNTKTS